MSGPSETSISNSIIKWINSLPNGYARKVHGGAYGRRGEPDIDAVIGGRSVKIEVKRPGQQHTLSHHQKQALKRWRLVGCSTFMATSVEETKEWLTIDGVNFVTGDGA